MDKRWIFFFIIALCLAWIYGAAFRFFPSDKVKIASDVREKAAKKLQDETGLIPFGFGSQMMEQIEKLEWSFQCPFSIKKEEGRWLLLKATKEFLSEINSHEKIRPYLDHYPFLPNDLIVRIFIQNPKGSDVGERAISLISSKDGIFIYKFADSNEALSKAEEETYEEALKKALLVQGHEGT